MQIPRVTYETSLCSNDETEFDDEEEITETQYVIRRSIENVVPWIETKILPREIYGTGNVAATHNSRTNALSYSGYGFYCLLRRYD